MKKYNIATFATFRNIIQVCKIGTFEGNLSTIFLKVLNFHLFSKIFQKIEIVMLRWNTLQYLTKMLRQYFNCNEILKIFLTSFYNILFYVRRFHVWTVIQYLLDADCIEAFALTFHTFHIAHTFFWMTNVASSFSPRFFKHLTSPIKNTRDHVGSAALAAARGWPARLLHYCSTTAPPFLPSGPRVSSENSPHRNGNTL